MTTSIGISKEDLPLLGGVAVAVAGTLTHNSDAVAVGLSLIAGKAIIKSTPDAPATKP